MEKTNKYKWELIGTEYTFIQYPYKSKYIALIGLVIPDFSLSLFMARLFKSPIPLKYRVKRRLEEIKINRSLRR